MNLKVDGIEMMVKKRWHLPLLEGRSMSGSFTRGTGVLLRQDVLRREGWGGFGQWLLGTPCSEISDVVEPFINRGMEIQERLPCQRMRGLHDLFLLHCAIFASSDRQLRQLAERVVDAAGAKGEPPRNDGDLLASAWSGMLKHWILGDKEAATAQSNVIWDAYRPPHFRAATKPLVSAWLSGKWDAFVIQQRKDFEKLWGRANKDVNRNVQKTKPCDGQCCRFFRRSTLVLGSLRDGCLDSSPRCGGRY